MSSLFRYARISSVSEKEIDPLVIELGIIIENKLPKIDTITKAMEVE